MKTSIGQKLLLLVVVGSMIFLHGCATTSSLNFNVDNSGKKGVVLCNHQSSHFYANEKDFNPPIMFGVCVYY